MFKLKVLLHGAAFKELVLNEEREFIIGRSSSCDLQLGDQNGISRQHLRVYCENGQWLLQVLSKFGNVIANGEEVKTLELHEDTIFKLPPFDFLFIRHDEEAPSAEIYESEAVREASLPQVIAPAQNSFDSEEAAQLRKHANARSVTKRKLEADEHAST